MRTRLIIALLLALSTAPAMAGEPLDMGTLHIQGTCDAQFDWTPVWQFANPYWAKLKRIDITIGVDGGTRADVQWWLVDGNGREVDSGVYDRYQEPSVPIRVVRSFGADWLRANHGLRLWALCNSFNNPAATYILSATFFYAPGVNP